MRRFRKTGLGLGLLALVGACDAGADRRAQSAFVPEQPEEDPVSAIEGLNFGAVAQSLVAQTLTPKGPEEPGSEEPEPEPEEPTPEPEEPTPPDGDSDGEPVACDGFECADGDCIDASWECDAEADCNGGEDEVNCDEACVGHTCGDGTCIQADWVCDDFVDCLDASDESACGVTRPGFDVNASVGPAKLDTDCVFSMTATSAAGGVVAAEIVTKTCETGGVIVGLATAKTGVGAVGGFGVAAVCGVADISQLDAVVGGVAGAVGGLVGGVTFCEGGVVDQAATFLDWLWGTEPESVPVYHVEALPSSSDEDAERAAQEAQALALLNEACGENTPSDAIDNCNLFFHYTDAAGFAGISGHPDQAILGDGANRVFLTWIPFTPQQVRNELVFQGNNAGKGDYVFAFRLDSDVPLRPDTNHIELVHEGTLRLRTRADVVYAGPNPMGVFE